MKLEALVDAIGRVKARKSTLTAEEKNLRAQIIDKMDAAQQTEVEGRLFRCTVAHFEVDIYDYQGIIEALVKRAKMGEKAQKTLFDKFKSTDNRVKVDITARTGKGK